MITDHTRRSPLIGLLAAGLLGTLALSGCGETRYIVVQSASAAAPAAPSAATPTTVTATTAPAPATTATSGTDTTATIDAPATTAVAAPAVSGPASAADSTAIQAALRGALGLQTKPFAERTPYLDAGASDLEATYTAVNKVLEGIDGSLRFGAITTDGDTALAIVDVIVSGADFATGLPVDLVRVDGAWKVTRSGACAVLTLASPCPDQ
ncbi:MAG: hypothetical protein JWM34_2416 [Ilumatobacteraceae bacterium]|nr:hypothetical protein [Ilumatobacteraceae bacterium]